MTATPFAAPNALHQYTQFCDDSTKLQQLLTSFASTLNTYIILFPDPGAWPCSFSTKEIDLTRERVYGVMSSLRQTLQTSLSRMIEVSKSVGSLSVDFRKMIDLIKYENERSSFTVLQLENQLKAKEKEIEDCQALSEEGKLKQLQEKWVHQHYLHHIIHVSALSNESYLQLLKEIRDKIGQQISFEKEKMESVSRKILKELWDFKVKVMEEWDKLGGRDNETKNQDRYSQFEKKYLWKEKRTDGFEFTQLNKIKEKLKLLEEAEVAESREYLSYSHSENRENQLQESEVVGLFHLP